MISRVNYKLLLVIPPAASILMILFLAANGVEYGLDFAGGTWIDVSTGRQLTDAEVASLEGQLASAGLADLKVFQGSDIESGSSKLTIVTTSMVDEAAVEPALAPIIGSLRQVDEASMPYSETPPADLPDKLEKVLRQRVDVEYAAGTLTIKALEVDELELENFLKYYLKQDADVTVARKNFNMRTVGPTLGKTFRDQGIKALIVAYILMSVVIFFAFRDVVPSFAVMLAATCDAILALGGMSVLGIPLEPATLAALLMLIGYSVDSDILLTARVLKHKMGELDERIDDAMKTGLTMTGTTLGVMLVIIFVSKTLTNMVTLYNIGIVLFMGLAADLATTWFTNAGILKWYVESPAGRKLRFRK